MHVPELTLDVWPVIMCVFAGFAWLIRLEAKVLSLKEQKGEMATALAEMKIKLESIAESLARLEGKLEHNQN